MPRKTYTRAFKLRAVSMMTDQGLSVAEVARRLGVGENGPRAWRAAAREPGAAAFPGPGHPAPAAEELRRLRAAAQRLKAERDLPRRAAAYSASPPSGRSASSPTGAATARSRGPAPRWTCQSPATTPGPRASRPGRTRAGPNSSR
jgi:transposase